MSNSLDKEEERLKFALEHAWNWFSLHATQRLQSMNFYLVAIAFLTTAFVTATTEGMYALSIVVALLGSAISFVFYRMERRIRTLIKAAEAVIVPIEDRLAKAVSIDAIRIVEHVEGEKAGEWKYSKVFRYLYTSAGTTFALGALGATWAIATDAPSPRAFDIVAQIVVGAFLLLFGHEILLTSPQVGPGRGASERVVVSIAGAISMMLGISVFAYLIFWRMAT